jgi:hypothetical protein
MTFTVTLDDARSPADRRGLLSGIAAALGRSGGGDLLVDWAADGLPGWENVDPRRVVGTANYSAALDDALAAAAGSVDWEPGGAGDPRRDRAVYRFAASTGMRPAVERVVLASLDPSAYLDRDADADDVLPLSVSACYAGLVEAGALVGVDWKSRRVEAAQALGGLLIVPDGRERFAGAVPGFPDLLRRCEVGDRADVGDGAGLPADDPLRADDEQPETLVAQEATTLAGAAGIVLLWLSNGDTPGYLACRAASAAPLLDLTSAAALPFERVR